MKLSEKETNDIILTFSLKTEHEQAKELKNYSAKATQLKKDLGQVESETHVLMREQFNVKDDPAAVAPIAQKVAAKVAQEMAIRDEIEQTAGLLTKLSDLHVETQVIKLLRRNRKLSVKAVEEMLKSTSA